MSLRFLFTTIGYPPFRGGAQTYVQQLAENLVRDGHQVTVYTTDAGEVESIWNARKRRLSVGVEEINGVVVTRFPLYHLPPSPLGYYIVRRLTVGLARLPATSEGLLWNLARYTPWVPELETALAYWSEPIDLVQGFAIPFESILGPAADCAHRMGVPYVVTPFLHTGESEDSQVERSYAMPHQLAVLRRAAAVVALSDIERDFLLQRGLAPDRVHTLPAGISDRERARPFSQASVNGGAPMVLFLGAVTYEKGAVHLTEALRRLWAEGRPIELALVGAVTDQYRRYYRGLPAEERARIKLHGVVEEDEKEALLHACTLLAMPSRVDSFGLAFLEAWAHGKPVIGARAGGIPAVIDDGENGLLVSFGDIDTLAAAILSLAQDPQKAERLGRAGQQKLRAQYTWDRVYGDLLRLYQQVLVS